MWGSLRMEHERLKRLRMGKPPIDAPDVQVSLPPRREPPPPAPPPVPQMHGTPRPPPVIVTPAPAVTTRRIVPVVTTGKPICVECRHYERSQCTSEKARHPVTGMYMDAERARRYEDGCGPKGRAWEARPSRTVEIALRDNREPVEHAPPPWVPVRKLEPFIDAQVVNFWTLIRECRDEANSSF